MASLGYFSVVGSVVAGVGDGPDGNLDPDTAGVSGRVLFTPLVAPGDLLQASTLSPTPSLVALVPVSAALDGNGQLVGPTKAPGVRLISNTSVLGLVGDLSYKVDFFDCAVGGYPVSINGFTFNAPSYDTSLNLVSLANVPGEIASGRMQGLPGLGLTGSVTTVAPGVFKFELEDGSFTDPVNITPNQLGFVMSFVL